MKIINVGIFPPPFGGVSIHLKRLLGILIGNDADTILIDVSGELSTYDHVINKSEIGMFFHLLFKEKKAIVHFHIFSLKLIFLIYLLSLKHICILSFHNERFLDQLRSGGRLLFRLYRSMLNNLDIIIVDNTKCKNMAEQFIDRSEKIKLIPEFIPSTEIPELELSHVIEMRKAHKYILSSNAYQISFHNNTDLYGIDLLIELMNILVNKQKFDVVFLFLLPSIGNPEYFNSLLERIHQYNLLTRFIFITNPIKEANSLWNISDLVIRATTTDGNSVSILEAQSLGIPVLASDCVERPQNTILFKTRDLDDLIEKTVEIMFNIDEYKDKMQNVKPKDNSTEFIQLYKKLA